ncbi:MAG: DNA mismatch repair protein MutS [Blastocatellia bacterium AA13]|nr:MAG: DNA mismatch repair protein MutS [Blastocatellia bacterium AA13]
MQNPTPMLKQYEEIKRRHPGTLLFFRLGDFYELFFDDALLGSKEMEITLTARHKERGEPIPMCGVPHHAVGGYIAKLIKKGYRVAICEQTEDASKTTKLVRREVVRIITPGTAVDSQLLDTRENNYLASIYGAGQGMAVAFVDLSTGEFSVTEFEGQSALARIIEQVESFAPSEILYPHALEPLFIKQPGGDGSNDSTANHFGAGPPLGAGASLNSQDDWRFNLDSASELLRSHFGVASLDGFGLAGRGLSIAAAGAVLAYVRETQKADASHITGISYFEPSECLMLDSTTVRNLELVEALDGSRTRTLLGVLDETVTGMGSRLLKQWVLRPSMKLGEINARLGAVGELKTATILRDQLRAQLKEVSDLERLMARISLGRATGRDLAALKSSGDRLPLIKELLSDATASLLEVLHENLDELRDLRDLIARAIVDDPPAIITEGGFIRTGYNAELDELREIANSSKSIIAGIETRERERTGISSLKVRFNNVFGYFIEVSKTNVKNVPPDYERRQTLTNAERYTTPELKEYEAKVLGAEERIAEIEQRLFGEIRQQAAAETKRVQAVAAALAMLDVLLSLGEVAARRNYCQPKLSEDDEVYIRAGRHPVVEAGGERFIPNDVFLNNSTDRLLIITGPNMGGKSVYLRQTALMSILAQMGSFVPAGEARMAIVDRVFTRVGASDSLARGRSTFMVEMTETANILNTATPRSLVLLDEVGRGTSTFDGLSLAWAIAEYMHDNAAHAAKTLFATHYHEMTELAKLLPGVRNYQMAVKESGGSIVFLRRVLEGSASKSYGLEVARIAGLPKIVIERAGEILINLEANELDVTGRPKLARHLPSRKKKNEPTLFEAANDAVVDELRNLDLSSLGQVESAEVLRRLKEKLL